MTEAEATHHKPPQRRGCWTILGRSLTLYLKHWRQFTGALLWPVTQIVLGVYASQILSLLLLQVTAPYAAAFPWVILGGVLVIVLLSILLMLRGTWQYLIYWASLCQNAWEADLGQRMDFRAAYDNIASGKRSAYTLLLCAYFGLPVITLLPIAIMLLMGLLLGPQMMEPFVTAGVVQSLILLVIWILGLFPLSFIFQIAAFEKGIPKNPGHTFLLSIKLALKRFWATCSLQLVVFLSVNFLIPQPFVWLVRALHATTPLDWLHGWLIRETMQGNESIWQSLPVVGGLLTNNQRLIELLAHTLTDISVASTVTLLLLPIGTLVFTLLYKDILRCDRSKETILGI